ncbi:WxL domain-containing protein, partial [Enterococcus mundtii]
MIIFRRQLALCITFLLILHTMPLYFIQTHAVTNDQFDEPALASSRENSLSYLALNNPVVPLETSTEDIQEFSFVEKTFRSSVGQPVILRFTSTLEAEEVLVRVPANGQIIEDLFTNDELISHSHGEYWMFKTKQKQTTFELPVIFDKPGNYFLTIDHDADHFYLEVVENYQSLEAPKTEDQLDLEETVHTLPIVGQPVMAKEENLTIPEELIKAEDERILEETRDSKNMARQNVSNWSGFRAAWNSGNTTEITMQSSINFSTSIWGDSLNNRSNSINISALGGMTLNLESSSNSLSMSSNGNLSIEGIYIVTSSSTQATSPVIRHTGSGNIDLNRGVVLRTFRAGTPVVHLTGSSTIRLDNGYIVYGSTRLGSAQSPVRLESSSNVILENGIIGSRLPNVPPITSNPSSNIYIRATNVMMTSGLSPDMVLDASSFTESWHSVDAHITGANGSIVTRSVSNPNDFSERYLSNYNNASYNTIAVNILAQEFIPPKVSYGLTLQATPSEGGSPQAGATTITQGEATTLNANPNETFSFIRWEIVSGTGSNVTNTTNEVTTFTMGTSDATVRAVYQKKQGGDITVEYVDESQDKLAESKVISGLLEEEYETTPIEVEGYTLLEILGNASGRFKEEDQTVTYIYRKDQLEPVLPVDPLDPEKEVDPENPPTLPEEQELLSIDFASQFNFGSQAISVHDQTYYAQPQRLLSEDGTVNESEERPNYVQISDRRPENDRHGWQLAVTQNAPFIATDNRELNGARLR